MDFVLVLLILFLVVLFVSGPLRHTRRPDTGPSVELAELEAVREAKYRELRDAELDYRTGKLSDSDYQALDGSLRAEAIEILGRIDRARGGSGEPAQAPSL